MVIQDDYIDMDLTPTPTPLPPPASPRFEFQFQSGGEEESAFASPADELFYKGNLLPLHLPPRLQLVRRLLQDSQNAAAEAGDGNGKVAVAKKPSWSRRLKVVKRWWASRDYIRSLFLATTATRPSRDVAVDGSARSPDEEVCHHHRKSFSGIIRRVRLMAAPPTPAPGVSPLCSSSSSSSSTPSCCNNANGFFFRPPALKRSGSAGSEDGAIQGAIAHCKRSQQPQGMGMASRRSSASDVVFCSVTNTPRASSVEVAREMCRGTDHQKQRFFSLSPCSLGNECL
jgi:hypothetical protein